MSMIETSNFNDDYDDEVQTENDDESGARTAWAAASWIIVALTIVLNVALIAVLLIRKNTYTLINKVILTLALADLIYGVFVSPFFVENYVDLHWNQSLGYCRFFEYVFTFHDLFVPVTLILLATYVSLKYSGAWESFAFKRPLYIACVLGSIILSALLAIPATYHATFFIDDNPNGYRIECRSTDNSITMILSYCLGSSILFCFTMSFLFSLCIVGSPFLRNIYDEEVYSQR